MRLTLDLLPEEFAICRLAAGVQVPDWAAAGAFWSISMTSDETSIVCEQRLVPPGVQSEPGWRALKVVGPLDFGLTGILASIAQPLAEAEVAIFAISTYDTDYVLVASSALERGVEVLTGAGHDVILAE